jgi:competence protein ComFC
MEVELLNIFRKSFIDPFFHFIFPPVCLACNKRIDTRDERVCRQCWDGIIRVDSIHPTWKEIKLKFDVDGYLKEFNSAFLFEKEGALQQLIHLLKYQGMKSLGIKLGEEVGKKIVLDELYAGTDYLIPIPLHKLKYRERGYNQSEFICIGISNVTKIPVNNSIIVRKKYTQTQTQLNLAERKVNVGDAFKLEEKFRNIVQGKTFLIVDDVITTGSTINSCAKVLLASGAGCVLAASVALAE